MNNQVPLIVMKFDYFVIFYFNEKIFFVHFIFNKSDKFQKLLYNGKMKTSFFKNFYITEKRED